MTRRRPSRPVMPSRVPGAKWVRWASSSRPDTAIWRLIRGGLPLAAVRQSVGRNWWSCAFAWGDLCTTRGTKRKVMRWVEKMVGEGYHQRKETR